MKIRKITVIVLIMVLIAGTFGACGSGDSEAKTTVYTNGVVYTVAGDDWDKNAAEAFVVDTEGKIAFVGSNADAEAEAGDGAEVVDLGGKTVLPGFIDGHVHNPGTALTELYAIDLYDAVTKEKAIDTISAFIEENPNLDIYWGTGYTVGIGGDPKGPKKEWLDEIESDKPIILTSNDGHNMWLNSAAFEINGITKDTKPPQGGSIAKDPATGELWGSITDASQLIKVEEEYDTAQQQEALVKFQENMLGWGYTAAMLIAPHSVEPEVLKAYDDQGDLKMKVNVAGLADPDTDFDKSLQDAVDLKDVFKDSKKAKVSTVKFFADGVVEGMTAYLEEPYDPAADLDPDYVSEPLWDPEDLKANFKKVLESGLQIHVHSIGDAATRDVVDGMIYAQNEVADFEGRNTITHLQVVGNDEKVKMGKNNIIGSTQPYWHFKEPEWFEVVDNVALGEERAWVEYPVKSLIDNGVMMTFSGDHPVSPVNNPMWAIEVSVTRNLENADYYGVKDITDINDPKWLLNPDERITVKQAIEAYTINCAYQLFREDEIGSLEVGKSADFIVLEDNILTIDPLKIDGVAVNATIIDGKVESGKL